MARFNWQPAFYLVLFLIGFIVLLRGKAAQSAGSDDAGVRRTVMRK